MSDSPRVGLIVRAENRGLGNQTWDLYRHLTPASTIAVDMSWNSPYEHHFDRYPDARTATVDTLVDVARTAGWFDGAVDVILTAETPYDYGLYEAADDAGVATVCQVNPEFWPHVRNPKLPRPTIAVSPTSWLNHRSPDVEVLPHPVDRGLLPYRARVVPDDQLVTFLHIAGHKAIMDRNGTGTVLQALARVTRPCRFVFRSQSEMVDVAARAPAHVEVVQHIGDVDDMRDLYADGDVLILPRRYGGQSLPMNEAASVGMGLVVSDLAPQNEFVPPAGRVACNRRRRFMTQGGAVDAWQVDPRALAAKIDELAADRALVASLSEASNRYADRISWATLGPQWVRLLTRAVDSVAT